jgi:hypothetical protein
MEWNYTKAIAEYENLTFIIHHSNHIFYLEVMVWDNKTGFNNKKLYHFNTFEESKEFAEEYVEREKRKAK